MCSDSTVSALSVRSTSCAILETRTLLSQPLLLSRLNMEDKSFLQKFIASHPVPQDAIDHFSSIPWTAPYLSHPLYVAIPTFSRILKPTGEDFFFSKTD